MTIIESTILTIAVLSFAISCYILIRDNQNRKFQNLHQCYNRIHLALDQKDVFTVSEYIEMEENPESEIAERIKAASQHGSSIVNRELDYACYLLLKKQLKLNSFFDLFGSYLAGRLWQLEIPYLQHKIINKTYLYKVLELCKKKKLLPLKNNKKYQKIKGYVYKYTQEERENSESKK